jgi:hypothetical protein
MLNIAVMLTIVDTFFTERYCLQTVGSPEKKNEVRLPRIVRPFNKVTFQARRFKTIENRCIFKGAYNRTLHSIQAWLEGTSN